MFDGIYGYFFGSDAQSTATTNDGKNDGNEWILVDQTSGRSSPVLVDDVDMQELRDEDIDSTAGDKQLNAQQTNRQRLRKIRKEVATQAKKHQVRELIQRRQEVEKKLFEDSSGTDSSSLSSSPIACTSSSLAKQLEGAKPVIQRKKKCANIKQPKGSKGDNRRAAK